MNDYKYSSCVLARFPLLDCHITEADFATILKRNDFRTALFFASRSFYNELSKKDFDYDSLSAKQKRAIKKYINRASFRSTPFGLFAFVSRLNWGVGDGFFEFAETNAEIKMDFGVMYKLWENRSLKPTDKKEQFQTNASLYCNALDFRYIKKTVEGSCAKFSVVSIEKNSILKSLANFCITPKTFKEILGFLIEKNVSPEEGEIFFYSLVQEQILVSIYAPNVTGSDYLLRHASYTDQNLIIRDMKRLLSEKAGMSKLLEEAVALAGRMDRYFNTPDRTNYFYFIGERKVRGGSLGKQYQERLEEGLYCLEKLAQPLIRKDLDAFMKMFVKRYETHEIPLLEALDAQFGIGYGGLDRVKVNYGFSSVGHKNNRQDNMPASDFRQNELANWFIKQCQSNLMTGFELKITDEQLRHLDRQNVSQKKGPSISVVFRTLGDKVFIESAGGVSALALIGRFCFFEEIYQYAKVIANEEQAQNKNVIFAEIAHLCDLHTANINRRPHFYDYEIPVLTNSQLPEEKQITLNDLMVSVRNNMIVLRSKSLNKIVIPRLSTAFNYSRNDLPIFRFLCDLQDQGIQTNLSFSLSLLVPGLRFYPRVSYKSSIIQLAEWHLDAIELRAAGDGKDTFESFRQIANSISLPKYFSYCVADNFLVFDRDKSEDVTLFLKEVEEKKTIVVKEFPFLDESVMQSKGGHYFLPQYIAALVLQKETYNGRELFSKMEESHVDTSDWVYFKLYCHPLSADIILLQYIFPLIEKLETRRLVTSWFWVRYNDPDYHLRIRAKAGAGSKQKVIQLASVCLDKVCSEKLASHFQTDRYRRELERYSPQLIDQIEDVFYESSKLLMGRLKLKKDLNYEDRSVILNAVVSSFILLNTFQIRDKAEFCKKSFEGFFTEFEASKELKTDMEKLYRQVQEEIDLLLGPGLEVIEYDCLIDSVKKLMVSHHERNVNDTSPEKLAKDIIHMHLNRLFICDQRYFEMIHYFLLYRALYRQRYKTIL